jgi:hypothetical protein
MPKALAILLALIFVIPSAVSAHEGHTVGHREVIKVGPYTVTAEQTPWPFKAKTNVDLVVTIEGAPKGTPAFVKLIPPPGSTIAARTRPLTSHPSMSDALTVHLYTIPAAGNWQLEFMVEGPKGKGVGSTQPFTVEGPPGLPLWLGWLIGFFPLVGLGWFLVRERRRVKAAIASDGGARI